MRVERRVDEVGSREGLKSSRAVTPDSRNFAVMLSRFDLSMTTSPTFPPKNLKQSTTLNLPNSKKSVILKQAEFCPYTWFLSSNNTFLFCADNELEQH